jgi:type VI secretion system protein ImpA
MATVAEPELGAISAPIPGDNPAGVDLRDDESHGSNFRRVRDDRNAARRAERTIDDGGDDRAISEATETVLKNWPAILTNGEEILTQWSKDLEIAAYMIEAYARLEGFGGLARGFRIARELVENFWDELYPRPDEEGVATRVLPLVWLNGSDGEGSLIGPLTRIPLTGGTSIGPFALWQYRQAVELASTTDAAGRQDRINQGAATREQIDRACNETSRPYEFFPKLVADIEECQREFKEIDSLLTKKCGHDAPPTSAITTILTDCLEAAKDIGKKWLSGPPGGVGANGEGEHPLVGARGGGSGSGLSSREDAFRQLLSVADFFERTEPQSMIPSQLRRVVEWGKLTPEELFTRLIEDSTALDQMYKLVGLSRPQQE